MLHRLAFGGMFRVATAAFVFSLMLAPSAFAKGGPGNDGRTGPEDKLDCPGKQVVVRTDEKLCPDKPGRPAVLLKRVCCQSNGATYCRPFHPCPPRSRS